MRHGTASRATARVRDTAISIKRAVASLQFFCHDKFATTHVTPMKIHLDSDQYDLMRLDTVHVQG